jgi:hypothetical protein
MKMYSTHNLSADTTSSRRRVTTELLLVALLMTVGGANARIVRAEEGDSILSRLIELYGVSVVAQAWSRVLETLEGTTQTAQVAGLLPTVPIPAVGAIPTATVSAAPTTIAQGGGATLTWTSTGATECTGTGFSTGGSTGGSASVAPTVSTTYVITCVGTGGTVTKNVTVTVTGAADTTAPTLSSIGAVDVSTTTKQNEQAFRVTWNTNEPTTGEVHFGSSPTVLTKSVTSNTLATSHTVVLYGLRKRTQYYFRIVATDSAGNSIQNSALSLTTTQRPAPVENLSAVKGSVRLEWTLPAGESIDSILIHRTTDGTAPDPGTAPLASIVGSATSYTDTAVTAGTSYTYTVYTLAGSEYSNAALVAYTTAEDTGGGSTGGGTSGGGSSGGGSSGSSSGSSGSGGSSSGGSSGGSASGGGSSGSGASGGSSAGGTGGARTTTSSTGGANWIHTITPQGGGSIARDYGFMEPYFTYAGLSAPVMKVHAAGDLIFLTAGVGSKLQQIQPTARIEKNGVWHEIALSGIWPLQTNGTFLGKAYYILRPTDPLYTTNGSYTAHMDMNLPGCSGSECFEPGWRLQQFRK